MHLLGVGMQFVYDATRRFAKTKKIPFDYILNYKVISSIYNSVIRYLF